MCSECMSIGSNNCPICSEEEVVEVECGCTEGVLFYINKKRVTEEEYNNTNQSLKSFKEFEICSCQE